MTKAEIDAVLERVRTWPPEQQEDAVWVLLEMEARTAGIYELDDEELADISWTVEPDRARSSSLTLS